MEVFMKLKLCPPIGVNQQPFPKKITFPGPYLCQLAAHPPLALVTHLVVEQPPLHIVRDNPAVSDKYFNPGDAD